tara:strand:+ start:626 stop:1165 length:540 start_codon:yes stop_codon:yes gene_type:complete
MMKNLDEFVYVENVLSREQCVHAIKTLDNGEWQPHRWYGWKDNEYHNNKDFDTAYSVDLQVAWRDNIVGCINNYKKKYPNCDADHFCQIRFNKYNESQYIAKHVDHIRSLFDGKAKGVPLISLVGLLNDDFEGGEFLLNGEDMELKAGDLLIFPSTFSYEHMTTPVEKGTRYSYVLWGW